MIEAGVLDKVLVERKILAKLNNPYICKLHFSFQTQTTLYLVMDFFNGGELFNQIHTGTSKRLPENRIKQYAAEIVCVLAFLHKIGIVYRDIKPENLILDQEGHINFVDMGLAIQDHNINDLDFAVAGTSKYMAPEIAAEEGHSFQSDWFSLGILIYEMFTKKVPHYHENENTMLKSRIADEKIEFNKKAFSIESIDFLKKILARNPKARLG